MQNETLIWLIELQTYMVVLQTYMDGFLLYSRCAISYCGHKFLMMVLVDTMTLWFYMVLVERIFEVLILLVMIHGFIYTLLSLQM
jgi:hypothetical protein